MHYRKFSLTLLLSFFIMYAVMFLNVDDGSHIYLSLTRFYMAILMVTPMAVIMMLIMRKMYTDKKKNITILALNIIIFILALTGLRKQIPIGDVQYMKAMIPHHSSAILTSKHADIKDPEVKKLSEQIIKSQEEEIAKMKQILKRMKK